MEDATVTQLQRLEHAWHAKGSQSYADPRPATRRALEDMHPQSTHKVAHVWRTEKGNTITTGDVVIFEQEGNRGVGEVVLLYNSDGMDFVILFSWERCRYQPHSDSVRLRARQSPLRICASGLMTSLIVSTWVPDHVVVVLLPVQFR